MWPEERPPVARVLLLTGKKSRTQKCKTVEDGKHVPALNRDLMQSQLDRLCGAEQGVEIYASVKDAQDDKNTGMTIPDFLKLAFGGVTAQRAWPESGFDLRQLGYTTSTTDDGMQVLNMVIVCPPALKRKRQDMSNGQQAQVNPSSQDAGDMNARAFQISLKHWPRCIETGLLYTFNPEKFCPKELKGEEWNVRICELSYRTAFKKLLELRQTTQGGELPFALQPYTHTQYRRRLQR